jgi:hypothetical protein
LTIAVIRLAADGADDPLPQVAGEVQEEVGDAVHLRHRPPPDAGVVELAEAVLDLGHALGQRVPHRVAKCGRGVGGWESYAAFISVPNSRPYERHLTHSLRNFAQSDRCVQRTSG